MASREKVDNWKYYAHYEEARKEKDAEEHYSRGRIFDSDRLQQMVDGETLRNSDRNGHHVGGRGHVQPNGIAEREARISLVHCAFKKCQSNVAAVVNHLL